MKTYNQLTTLEKDFAADACLKILITKLVTEEFDFKFKSALAQKHFHDAMVVNKYGYGAKDMVWASDEIAEELYPIAETLAERAYYPGVGEICLEGINKAKSDF